jgi:hypothetical protein
VKLRIILNAIQNVILNMAKFIDKYGLSEHKHCDNTATDANSENAISRMEASSVGKRVQGGKGR